MGAEGHQSLCSLHPLGREENVPSARSLLLRLASRTLDYCRPRPSSRWTVSLQNHQRKMPDIKPGIFLWWALRDFRVPVKMPCILRSTPSRRAPSTGAQGSDCSSPHANEAVHLLHRQAMKKPTFRVGFILGGR